MKIESFLPVFPGFYQTLFESDEEPEIEEGKTYDDYEWDHKGYRERVARACVGYIEDQLKEFKIKITFQNIHSPREYNFTNDTINVEYSLYGFRKIRDYIDNNEEAFQEYLTENYTSGPGFSSFHSTDVQDWLENAHDDHKFGAILGFILNNEDEEVESNMANYIADQMYVTGTLIQTV